jgi:tetratricopeptide (TPR) repeat protein
VLAMRAKVGNRFVGLPTLVGVTDHAQEDSLYLLVQKGMALLESGDYEQATVPLAKAAKLAPEKSSIREALGRAYFRSRRFPEAATEFEAVLERYPVNDYAHFCLGRALSLSGQPGRARRHLALAANLRPDRRDYRIYRERLTRR